MRLIYADPGLMSNVGHHATICRGVLSQAHDLGLPVLVFGGVDLNPGLANELGATPLFRVSPYCATDGDALCGWLNAFLQGAHFTSEDFARLPALAADDVLYLTGCAPTQLLGLIDWLATLAPNTRPRTVGDLIYNCGLEKGVKDGKGYWMDRDPRVDPRALLYRFVGLHMKNLQVTNVRFVTEHPGLDKAYSELLRTQVEFNPALPQALPPRLIDRRGRRPITLGVVGHQRQDKGYPLMPDVFRTLLSRRTDIRVLAHNSNTASLPQAQETMRALAKAHPHVTLDERQLDKFAYQSVLDSIDLMLCTYSPAVYQSSLSGVVIECMANGIPVVVPAKTTLADELIKYGEAGTIAEDHTSVAIVEATNRALDSYDKLAEAALHAAKRWADDNRGRYLQNVLDWAKT